MGLGRLNIWMRDDFCKVLDAEGYVTIRTCDGKVLEWCKNDYTKIPLECGHAEVDVPPGCYIVRAVFCCDGGNYDTDRAMVIVGCDDDACVNLIAPEFRQCAESILLPFVEAAIEYGISKKEIMMSGGILVKAAELSEREMNEKLDMRLKLFGDSSGKMLEEVRGIIKGMW